MKFNRDIFKIQFNNVMPSKGCVLISEPFLQDKYFQRSVVYLIDHTEKGSMGLVLNKELEIDLSELMEDLHTEQKLPVFLGGPVAVETLFYLHTLESIPESLQVSDNLYLNGDFDLLKDYINTGGLVEGKIKFFFGYSGWEAGQLMAEIKQNAWLVGDITDDDVLRNEDEKVWEESLESLGEQYKVWTKFPKNPSLN